MLFFWGGTNYTPNKKDKYFFFYGFLPCVNEDEVAWIDAACGGNVVDRVCVIACKHIFKKTKI